MADTLRTLTARAVDRSEKVLALACFSVGLSLGVCLCQLIGAIEDRATARATAVECGAPSPPQPWWEE